MDVNLKALFAKLNPYCKKALEDAASACVGRGGYEVTIEDLLLRFTEAADADVPMVMRHYGVDVSAVKKLLHHEIEQMNAGNTGKPVFSPLLIGLIRDGWLLASTDFGLTQVRSGVFMAALNRRPAYTLQSYGDLIGGVSVEDLIQNFQAVTAGSKEAEDAPSTGSSILSPLSDADSALARFTTDFTELARNDELDPVLCRDREIRQMIDILSRRRKNNPIVVGDAGVGKTAVVEGLALKVAAGDAPDSIKEAAILGLDLGLLQAGASVKGEFEKRLRNVIAEIKSAPVRIILFIDEAHALIGAGGAPGGGDAANLLKPALARGELRAIAATTWTEYKKYFEKDHALERRFQLVKLDEPSSDAAATILRGLKSKYEAAHNVYVRDDAVAAAAHLSARYISGRQLPDKAVDVLDTACARVGVSMTATPYMIEDMTHNILALTRERDALARDMGVDGSLEGDAVAALESRIAGEEEALTALTDRWKVEKAAVDRLMAHRLALHEIGTETTDDARREAARENLKQSLSELARVRNGDALVDYEVTPETVSRVISDWTGIPLGKILRDEADTLNRFGAHMRQWIKGQHDAAAVIGDAIRTAKSGLGKPDAPLGVFLLVGPSGVGKTETAIAVAELLFGGRHALISVNMSEFQEKHTISRLIGSPPGYVGFGEGGVLTEAVRQRPYSAVLLDEVEKAAVDVLNLFYQVFDKGVLADGEGREIDFRNTVMFLTSNLASELISQAYRQKTDLSAEEAKAMIWPALTRHFKPALLARMEVIPYLPLSEDVLSEIISSKVDKVADRLLKSRGLRLSRSPDLNAFIAGRCADFDSGARDVDHVIHRHLLPKLSSLLMAEDAAAGGAREVKIEVTPENELFVEIETA